MNFLATKNISQRNYFAHINLGEAYPKQTKDMSYNDYGNIIAEAVITHFGDDLDTMRREYTKFCNSNLGKDILKVHSVISYIRGRYRGNLPPHNKITHTIQNITPLQHLNSSLYVAWNEYDTVMSQLLPLRKYIRVSANPKNVSMRIGWDIDIRKPVSRFTIDNFIKTLVGEGNEYYVQYRDGGGVHVQTFQYIPARGHIPSTALTTEYKREIVAKLLNNPTPEMEIIENAGNNLSDVLDISNNQSLPWFLTIKNGEAHSTIYTDGGQISESEMLSAVKDADVSYCPAGVDDKFGLKEVKIGDKTAENACKKHNNKAVKVVDFNDKFIINTVVNGTFVDKYVVSDLIRNSPPLNTNRAFRWYIQRIKEAFDPTNYELLYSMLDHRLREFKGYDADNNRRIFDESPIAVGGIGELISIYRKDIKVPTVSEPKFNQCDVDIVNCKHISDSMWKLYDSKNCRRDILCSSKCNTGKSYWMKSLFQRLESEGKTFSLWGFRKSLNTESVNKLRTAGIDMRYYDEMPWKKEAILPSNRMAIQYESIHKMVRAKIDVIVIDEARSFIDQISADLLGNKDKIELNNAAMEFYLRNADRVILLDNDIDDTVTNWHGLYRSNGGHILHNTYQPFSDRTAEYIHEEETWERKLVNQLLDGKKVFVATNYGRGHIDKLARLLKYRTQKNIFYITGQCAEKVKIDTFSNVDKKWAQYDCVIVSPVCQAGNSFEREHFDSVFGLFKNSSNTSRDAYQQLHRVRNISTNMVYIHCKESNRCEYLPTSVEEAQRYITTIADPLGFTRNFMNYSRDLFGHYKYVHKDEYYWTKISTLVARGKDRIKFRDNLMQHLVNAGYKITQRFGEELSYASVNPNIRNDKKYNEIYSKDKKFIMKNAPDTLNENIIGSNIHNNPELNTERSIFLHTYKIIQSDLTTDLLRKYNKKHKMRRQKNCYYAHNKEDIKLEDYGGNISADAIEKKKLKCAYDLLQYLLITDGQPALRDFSYGTKINTETEDQYQWSKSEMENMLDYLDRSPALDDINALFKRRYREGKWKDKNFKQRLSYVNNVLRTVFDMSFSPESRNSNTYILKIDTMPQCGYFTKPTKEETLAAFNKSLRELENL